MSWGRRLNMNQTEVGGTAADAGGRTENSVVLDVTLAGKVSFATHQNAIPVLRDLEISNSGTAALEDVRLEIESVPPVIVPKTWRLDRIAPGASVRPVDRDVALNAALLLSVNEAVRADVRLSLRDAFGVLLAEHKSAVDVLARNEWGGAGAMPELLASFVQPNDSAVADVLRSASEILGRAGKRDTIEGYQSKSRTRVYEIASAIWSAVVGLNLTYVSPPASFEQYGQKIRTPGQMLDKHLATCLDSSVLFAAAFEQAGLHPILVLLKEHAFVGVWLQPEEFSTILVEDVASLRKRFALNELIVFETTMATSRSHVGFSNAIAEGTRKIAEETEADFVLALDIQRARMQKLRPLALEQAESGLATTNEGTGDPANEPLEAAPVLPDFDVAEREVVPTTAEGRLERWQRKLLDLSVRNRLLNLKPGAVAIRLYCTDPAVLEDRIAGGEKFKIVSVPPLEGTAGRDAGLHLARTGRALDEDYASAALERGELLCPLPSDKLDSQLTDLFRKARLDFAEGGANTLFLALGFLSWRKADGSDQNYRAPLILVPVKLERRSARSAMALTHHEDETRFNLTLLQMLRQDFELEIPELAGPQLPGDESGVDVPGIWNRVRRAVRDMAGFEVTEEVMLGTFSFAKYLMWKDLVDRTEALKANSVVQHLLDTPREAYVNGAALPATESLDREIAPGELFTPLPADSSQLAAVIGSARGCDFVLDGPPGTGKSQTIANIIAHNLALGRKVLFVAEKRAALEVVYRRLKANGLGQFCLELHSNKAAKVDVLNQLNGAWTASGNPPAGEWEQKASELKAHRDALNKYVAAMHRQHPNGMTLHYAIGLVARDGENQAFRLNWQERLSHDRAAMDGLREAAHRLSLTWPKDADRSLRHVARSEWSNLWQSEIVAAADKLGLAAQTLGGTWEAVCGHIGVSPKVDRKSLAAVSELCGALLATKRSDYSFATSPDAASILQHISDGIREAEAYRNESSGLSAEYPAEVVRTLNASFYMQQWHAASGSIWPFSVLKKSSIEKAIRPAGAAKVDPAKDLPLLAGLRRRLERLDALPNDVFRVPQWAGVATDLDKLKQVLEDARQLCEIGTRIATTPEEAARIKNALHSLCGENKSLLDTDAPVGAALLTFTTAHGDFLAAFKGFEELAGGALSLPENDVFTALAHDCDALSKHAFQLNGWCAWRRSRLAACDAGLQPLVETLEQGGVQPTSVDGAFELAYARWFAETQIDADPVLRTFNRNEHEDVIARFRRVDDEFSALTRDYIRARILQQIPPKDARNQPPGFGALAHQLTLQRRHKPVRQLVAEMGPALTTLAPCLLMSPLSVAQYLPPDAALFDLVIFDEASQITPWDAVGAIARGKQVIVAGDPKQMPPTNFFDRGASLDEDDSEIEQDMESILDECLGARLPSRRLTWHYRSRHESLITFSNHNYYDGDLITFPAPVTRDSAVSLVTVQGVWSRGKSRTNQVEAEALVAEVVRRLQDPGFRDEKGEALSLGIITLNSDQQRLVEDLLDVARKRYPALEPFFADGVAEPVIVKNLETVQGDERDLILLGIGFGPETLGAPTMPMNFGPLNRAGGWRRLNVAVTRARREMMIFASFPAHFIDLKRTSADAVRDLKHYLEFAERGPKALGEAVAGSLGGYESPFEQAVARGLGGRGWATVPQIGVSRFRIDLGIVHPDRPGDFLVGVECDGAAYHSAATARDRDKVRAAVLRELGWNLLRVWSTDWWVDSRGALDRLDTALKQLLEKSRVAATPPEEATPAEPGNVGSVFPTVLEPLEEAGGEGGFSDVRLPAFEPHPEPVGERLAAGPMAVLTGDWAHHRPVTHGDRLYRFTDFADMADVISPDQFQEPSYIAVLRTMVRRIIEREAPVRDTILVERIARAHGFQRSGRLIRDRVMSIVLQEGVLCPEENGTIFIWPEGPASDESRTARVPASDDDVRALEDIALEELAAGMCQCRNSEVDAARLFGIKRLSSVGRDRLLRSTKA